MSRDGGFGRAARVIVDDPDPSGGPSVCDDAATAPLIHADAQVILCTELSLSPRGTGALTLYAQGRLNAEEGWRYARRTVPVADFNFEGALAEALNGFFVATPQRGFSQPVATLPAAREAEATWRAPAPTPATGAPRDIPSFGSTEIAEGSGGAPPSVTVALIVTSLIDDTFQASVDIGLGGQLSLALTGGGQSQSNAGIELSSTILGGALRAYFMEPMSGLYGSVGITNVSTKFSFLTVETTGSYTMLQPAVGVKLTGSPGLAVGLEAGFRLLLSDEVTLVDDSFEPAVAAPMMAFFRKALARDAGQRFSDLSDLAQAWAAIFVATDRTAYVDDSDDDDDDSGDGGLYRPPKPCRRLERCRQPQESGHVHCLRPGLGFDAGGRAQGLPAQGLER
jgi:hypothetical protein